MRAPLVGVETGAGAAAQQLASALKALANPQRLRIIEVLDQGKRSSAEIGRALGLSPQAVGRHLRALAKVGLVGRDEPGKNGSRFALRQENVARVNAFYLVRLGKAATPAGQPAPPSYSGEGLVPLASQPTPQACLRCQHSSYVLDLLEESTRLLEEARGYQSRLRQLSTQVLTAQEEERKRIARDLHDDTAQALTSLLVRLRLLERSTEERGMQEALQELRQLTSSTLEGVRRLALALRPSALDDLGLAAAVQAYIKDLCQRWPLSVHFVVSGRQRRLPAAIELALYRVVQEALTNVAKHSAAAEAKVALNWQRMAVTVTVEDQGRGFDSEEIMNSRDRGLGLFGMQERLALVGGTLTIDSSPGQGTRVMARIPLPRVPPASVSS